MNREEACPLIEAGYNAAELALALEVSGQTARGHIREFRATGEPRRAKPRRDGWSWMEPFSLTQLWSLAQGSH